MAPVKARYRAYFEPQRNVTFKRHIKFRAMKQGRERVDDWVTEFRRQASRCDYGSLRNSVIREHGCTDEKCRERMLRDNALTLERAMEILRTAELTSSQLKTMGSGSSETVQMDKKKTVLTKDLTNRRKNAEIVDSSMSGRKESAPR